MQIKISLNNTSQLVFDEAEGWEAQAHPGCLLLANKKTKEQFLYPWQVMNRVQITKE